MDWFWLVVALIVFIVVMTLSNQNRERKTKSWFNFQSGRQAEATSSAHVATLQVLRREIANYLIRNDPDRFEWLYRKAQRIDEEIRGAGKERANAELTVITGKYPSYANFDLIGTREHVLYADAFQYCEIEDVEDHYLNLVRFHALKKVVDESWTWHEQATDQKNHEHLVKYARRVKDTRFMQRMNDAVDLYESVWAAKGFSLPESGALLFENKNIEIHHVPHFAESRYGVVFKDTGECGIFSSFYDDGRDKTYRSVYRSDLMFKTETVLDAMRLDQRI